MKTFTKSLFALLAAVVLFINSAAAFSQDTGITSEMIAGLKTVGESVLDPSGQNIAYSLRVPRSEGDAVGPAYSEIWIVPVDGGEPRQYTSKPNNSWSPRWSPDGKEIAFLSSRPEHDPSTQVYIIPFEGGEARKVMNHETSVSAFSWSPDGEWIAFIATDAITEEEKKADEEGRDWIIPDRNFKHRRLWIMNVMTGESQKVYEEDLSTWSFVWTPDSRTIVFQATDAPRIDDSYMFRKIYRISVTNGHPELVCTTTGKLGGMSVSPDGSRLAFLGAVSLNDPLSQSLFVVPLTGGDPQNLTIDYEGSAVWTGWQDNGSLILLSMEGTQTTLNRIDVNTGVRTGILDDAPVINTLSFDPGTGRIAAVGHSAEHPAEVYTGMFGRNETTRLTNHNPRLDDVKLARQEVAEWRGADGWRIQGILTYPLNYEQGQRYPLVLQIHGGPEGVNLNGWNTTPLYPVQYLAANGYMVLQPNYRGSAGKGVAFSKADHDDLGGKEFEDVLEGIDALVDRGLVDIERVGTGGWSYGGYFSAWAATRHSNRFKASVVAAGLTNWISFAGTTDIPYEMSLVHWNSWWYDEPALHWERSPLFYINDSQTPTLVVHGMADKRVHPEQGIELYTAMKIKGIPTELVLYPREPHGLTERAHELDFMQRVLGWYDRYLKKGLIK